MSIDLSINRITVSGLKKFCLENKLADKLQV